MNLSEPRRNRTFNLRIKSPLLYQLSYGPETRNDLADHPSRVQAEVCVVPTFIVGTSRKTSPIAACFASRSTSSNASRLVVASTFDPPPVVCRFAGRSA